jgi:tetratricopeptide (TPR) repeat protein
MGSSFIPFISYSSADGSDFAHWLYEELRGGVPPVDPWIDVEKLPPGYSYSFSVDEAIGGCDLLLAVVSRDSTASPGMDRELLRAERYNKPLVPLRIHREAGLPFPLEGRRPIDFSANRPAAMERLCRLLDRLMSSQGVLDRLREELRSARHELAGATDSQRRRIQRDIERLEKRIAKRRQAADDFAPNRSHKLGDATRDRPGKPASKRTAARPGTRYINELPSVLTIKFLDRKLETEQLQDTLGNDLIRLVTVCGSDGVGKTMMVAELLRKLGSRRERPSAVIWLRAHGARPVSAAVLLADLGKAAPKPEDVEPLLENPELTVVQKLDAVLGILGKDRIVVAIDNLEDLIDADSEEFRDAELDRLLRRLAIRGHHRVKVILVGQMEPSPLLQRVSGNVERLRLDAGLRPPHTQRLLRRFDEDGTVGLLDAPDARLVHAGRLVDGHPRALEAIYTVLSHDRNRSLELLLEDMEAKASPDQVRDFLIGLVHDQLDQVERRVVQALAVYGRPVPADAVEYLLRPYLNGLASLPVFEQLLAERTIRHDGERYYLPSADRLRVLRRIPRGKAIDREGDLPPLTQLALFHRAAEYFAEHPEQEIEGIDDLTPQLNEIDLRLEGEEYEAALELIHKIDVRYLERWGYSQVLVGRLLDLVDKVGDPQLEITTLDLLANAEQSDDQQAIEHHSRALIQAQGLADPEDLARLSINLGSDFLDGGYVRDAAGLYGKALELAHQHRLELEEAHALVGLSLCDAETGQFSQALTHRDQAVEIIRRNELTDPIDRDDLAALEVELLLNAGYWYGLLGEAEFALDQLRQGQELADERDLRLLQGQFMVMTAEVVLDQADADPAAVDQAVKLAEDAVELGEANRNPALLREAYCMLALGQLCAGSLELARTAADAASRYQATRTSLGAFLLQGITALCHGDCGNAIPAFTKAHLQAARLRARDDQNFLVADIDGLALCGLALCSERERLKEAEAAFKAARKITSEPGVVKRTVRLLDAVDPEGLLATARRYAAGQP